MARIALLAALAASVAPRAVAGTDLLRTRTGFTAHWVDYDITVGFDRGTPSRTVAPAGVKAALQAAIEAWNEVPELPARFHLVTTPDPAVRVRFCRGQWVGDLDDLGKAVFTADLRTGVVASAVVEINECDRSFLAPDEVQDGRFDLQAVLAHELGHVLGLGHSDNPNTLMFSHGGTAGIRTPKADDRAGIARIYGPPPLVAAGEPSRAERPSPQTSGRAPTERAVRSVGRMPPAEVLTMMRVAGSDGTAMIVYTSEPTLLPPVSPVESEPDQKRQTLGRHRQSAGPEAK
jgi:hypothetical protein